jgi:hypothetical protein
MTVANTEQPVNDKSLADITCKAVYIGIRLHFFKHVFSYSAQRTHPILRDIVKSCSRHNTAVRISLFRIIDVPAGRTYVFIHSTISLKSISHAYLYYPSMAYYNKFLQYSSRNFLCSFWNTICALRASMPFDVWTANTCF